VGRLGRAVGCPGSSRSSHVSGVEARGGRKHAGKVRALHRKQLEVRMGEAGGALVTGFWKSGVGSFTEALHGAKTKTRAVPPPRKKQIGDHSLPRKSFGISSPRGAVWRGDNARQHGTGTAAREDASSEHTCVFACRHPRATHHQKPQTGDVAEVRAVLWLCTEVKRKVRELLGLKMMHRVTGNR
jgi:hypothetical protein